MERSIVMKLTRKILALLLCLTMVMGLATTAFADESSTVAAHNHYISIENNREGYVYTAYQIFSGDVDSTGVLSNIEWGSAIPADQIDAMMAELVKIDAFADCTDANSVAALLSSAPNLMDDPIAIAFADVVSQFATVAAGTFTFSSETGKYTIYNLDDGYYLVKNTVVPEGVNATYTRYMLKVVADVNIAHKGSFPQVEKKIVEGEDKVDVNEAFIGEAVNYEIVGTLPNNIDVYDSYYYVFRDTLSKGLTYNNDAKITVNGVNVTDYFYKNASAYTGDKYEGGTSLVIGIQDLLALELLEDPTIGPITAETKVVLTYSATLNENAIVGGFEGNPNKVVLEYDNNPNNDGDGATTPPPENPDEPTPPDVPGKTPEDEVTTFTTELTLQKVDGTGKFLTGAEFTLTSDTGVTMTVVTKYVFTEDANGTYWKLNDGTYTLSAEIENVAGSTLPSTGGMGTTLFYILGSVMVIGAAVLLITKKRIAA